MCIEALCVHDFVPSRDVRLLSEGVRVKWVDSSMEVALEEHGMLEAVRELLCLLFASAAEIRVSELQMVLEPSITATAAARAADQH